ncbi:hypothetical protein AC623_09945 [Bacillus sp. FJAT-27231]|uniref:hypothetical protein n=1 Tax=Bacillus sp. FJAT-27231 TaxID=1679168 RepID=UPI000670E46C|nr:hypothetical protein [Bacillus sp. FJAT-27231]KMY54215.1 hypothetical protein AC623_09945 [Bacillus sp. FJAT-27231]
MDQEHILDKLEELYEKLNALETSIHRKGNLSIVMNIDVKDLHLQELNLEELAFHLDKLDIKELSGMLNLGNAFSPVVHPKKEPEKANTPENREQTEKKKQTADDIKISVNEKSVPYTID